jgi:hypothetical protein
MKLQRPRTVFIALLAATVAVARFADAASVETTLDNDTNLFVPGAATTDRNYTQGSRVVWHGDPDELPRWAQRVSDALGGRERDTRMRRFGVELGQEIYTPDAISSRKRIVDDRPYAGWLYGGAFVAVASERRERSLELRAGMVGPAAQAEEAQTWWHSQLGIRIPRGWQYQLRNEPAVVVRYEERLRPAGRQRHFDVVPHAAAAVGNLTTYAAAGATMRMGLLPDDFGPGGTTRPAAGRTQLYAFARAEGRAVARDLFLDGNTFAPGPHVTRIPWVGETQMGVGARWRSMGLRYLFSYTTNQFREHPDSHEYGSFAISF